MARESIGTAEFERLVARTGNADYLARAYAGRKDGMTPAECVALARRNDDAVAMASGTVTGRTPAVVTMAVCRAANSLAARGRERNAWSLFLNVPVDMEEPEVRAYLREAYETVQLSDVSIIRTKADTVTAYAVAYGKPCGGGTGAGTERAGAVTGAKEEPDVLPKGAECRIVLCGLAGAEETILLYGENRERLEKHYPEHFLKDIPLLKNTLDATGYCRIAKEHGAVYQYALGDGGVYAGLFAMSERLRTGLSVELPRIPISQKTIEICEELDTDPYQIGSGGCVLMITADAETLLSALWAAGAEAADIGCLREGFAKELHNGEEVRFLEPLRTKKK